MNARGAQNTVMRFLRLITRSLILLLIALFSALAAMRFAIHGREVRVPNLKGLTVLQAQEMANQTGLIVTVDDKFYSSYVPEGKIITILKECERGMADNTPVYKVPEGHYFMMGDNRDNSTDSRVLSQVGYVPGENIIGKAQIIFFSIKDGAHAWEVWRWPWTVRWNRLFTIVR